MSQKKYWNSLQHLEGEKTFLEQTNKEFTEHVPVGEFLSSNNLDETTTSRRDFLKFLGFSISAATLAACEAPVMKSVPYVVKPEEITPGVPNYYASSYYDGHDYCSVLVKTREGRPIFIEGNKLSNVTKGALNARVNSSVLSLYDSKRVKAPRIKGEEKTWAQVDKEIGEKLKNAVASGKKVVILSNTIISPSTQILIQEFSKNIESFSNIQGQSFVEHVTYDTLSYSGMLNANEKSFGKKMIPSYHFNKAKVVVSLSADFIGNWLSGIEFSKQFAETRKPENKWMSKHYHFESTLSLTGSNADERVAVKPSEIGKIAVLLYNEIAKKAGSPSVLASEIVDDSQKIMDKVRKAANHLWEHKGESIVACGSNDENTQIVVNSINQLLGNYGSTIDTSVPVYTKKGDDKAVEHLIQEMNDGKVDVLITYNLDPLYSLPSSLKFNDGFSKVKTKITFSDKEDFTSVLCDYVCPDHHYLESWNDANPKEGHYSLAQPVIKNLYNTRQAQDSLMIWGNIQGDFYTYIQKTWEQYGYPRQTAHASFREYWSKCLHDGISQDMVSTTAPAFVLAPEALGASAANINAVKGGAWELELYPKISMGDGSQANNPWLQELPDPITKVVWDNYITMNPLDMKDMGFNTNIQQEIGASLAKVTVGTNEVLLPVFPVPGQKRKAIGMALGYGKARVGNDVIGKNVFSFTTVNASGNIIFSNFDVKIEKVEGEYPIASLQTHHTMMGRKIVNETTLSTFLKGKDAYNKPTKITDAYGEKKLPEELNLWADHPIASFGHRWGMSIDLNSCTGCSACVTACTAENNVSVVGKDEVRRNRDMFWLRIDRYFTSDMTKAKGEEQGVGSIDMYSQMEVASEYPSVVHQPVMCQHCNHAPCETVCPVAATTHSNEGLNQMAYNRCVGTRYCANNCPYKVRRFNWFQYDSYSKFSDVNPAQDEISRMVLNPDVTVRSRGVMEKCSMCVQKIQAGKLEAKKKGDKIQDGAIVTACSSACPTNAITFGDLNDTTTQVKKEFDNDRAYFLLEEVGTQPNIKYLTKVRNIESIEA